MSVPTASLLSPAELLARDPYARVEVCNELDRYVAETEDRVTRLALELQAAEREAARARDAYAVAYGLTGTYTDTTHGRRPGDVAIRRANGREYLILSIDASEAARPKYLTVRHDMRNERPGDAAPAAWLDAGEFLLP